MEDSGKPEWLEIEQHTSAFGFYYDDNILGGSIHTINKNTVALVVASKEIGLCLEIRTQDEVTI